MLSRAFHDDPAFGWMFAAQRSRHRRTRRYFLTEMHHESLRHGAVEVARVDGRVAGAAGWFPPGTWAGTEASAMLGYLRACGRHLITAYRYQSEAVRAHPGDYLAEDYDVEAYYLRTEVPWQRWSSTYYFRYPGSHPQDPRGRALQRKRA